MAEFHDIVVNTLVRALTNLESILKKGEKWCEENNVPKEKLLEGKLADDMKPLIFQVTTCSNTAKLGLTRLGVAKDLPVWEDNEATFPQLYERIRKTIALLKTVKPEAFEGKFGGSFEMQVGQNLMKFKGVEFVENFLLPNYFFHEVVAYAILRNQGVPVGKMDYLGDYSQWKA